MEGLGHHDAGSHAEEILGLHKRSSPEIGTRADAFEDGRERDEADDVVDGEIILAG